MNPIVGLDGSPGPLLTAPRETNLYNYYWKPHAPLLLTDATTVTTPDAEPLSVVRMLLRLLDAEVPKTAAAAAPAKPLLSTSSSNSKFTPRPFLVVVTVAHPPLRHRDIGTTPYIYPRAIGTPTPTVKAARIGDTKIDNVTPPVMARFRFLVEW